MAQETNKKRVFDIAKPGKVAADASSRPLIVGHRSIVQDPMVDTSDKDPQLKKNSTTISVEVKAPEETPIALLSAHPTIELIPEVDKNVGTSAEKVSNVSGAAESDKPKNLAVLETATSLAAPELTEDKQTTEDKKDSPVAPEIEPLSEPEGDETDKEKVPQQETEEEKAKREALQKLIDDKQYFVHVDQVKSTRVLRRVLMIVIILLIVGIVVGDLAIDAGLIKTNIKPLTHLIRN